MQPQAGNPDNPRAWRRRQTDALLRLQRPRAPQGPGWDAGLPELYKNTFLGWFSLAVHWVVICYGSHPGTECK